MSHVKRRPLEAPVGIVNPIENSTIIRSKERPRKAPIDTIKKDLHLNGLFKNLVYDKTQWQHSIHVANRT